VSFCFQRIGPAKSAEEQFSLQPDQPLVFGSGEAADVVVARYSDHETYHLKIWEEDGRCIAENLLGVADAVSLNGRPFLSIVEILDGDCLSIEEQVFHASEVREVAVPVSEDCSPLTVVAHEVSTPCEERALVSTVLSSGVRESMPAQPAHWSLADVVTRLSGNERAFLLVNPQCVDGKWHSERIPIRDLYSAAPDAVRDQFSLTCVLAEDLVENLQIYDSVKHQDAAVWVIPRPSQSRDDWMTSIYLSWFSRPSNLEFTLHSASSSFREALMKPFRAIILKPAKRPQEWVAYTSAEENFEIAG